MKKILFIMFITFVLLFSYGCGKSREEEVMDLAEETLKQMQDQMEKMPDIPNQPGMESELSKEDESEKTSKDQNSDENDDNESENTEENEEEEKNDPNACNSDLEPHQARKIKISLEDEPIMIEENGFSFRVFPLTPDDEVVPLTGRVTVKIFPTTINDDDKGREIDGKEMYTKGFYLKKDDVQKDCGSQLIEIKFDDAKWSKDRLKMAEENDPGIMIVEMQIGMEEFETRYLPWKHDVDSILPKRN